MAGAMFLQYKLQPTPADPMQAKVFMILPIVMSVTFAFFPAGLVLYWVTNTILTILQQWNINRRIEAAGANAELIDRPRHDRRRRDAAGPRRRGHRPRVAGRRCRQIARRLIGLLPQPRHAHFARWSDAAGEPLDFGLALYFPAPEFLHRRGRAGAAGARRHRAGRSAARASRAARRAPRAARRVQRTCLPQRQARPRPGRGRGRPHRRRFARRGTRRAALAAGRVQCTRRCAARATGRRCACRWKRASTSPTSTSTSRRFRACV